LARIPAGRLAVSPVIPVEEMVWEGYPPALPPAYGTDEDTPEAVTPEVKLPVLVADPQVNEVTMPIGKPHMLLHVVFPILHTVDI